MQNRNEFINLFDEFYWERQFSNRLSIETLRGYKAVFDLFLRIMPEVSDTKFLTPEMITEFFKRLQTRQRIVGKSTFKTGVKNSTIVTYRNKLNTFFEWLCSNGKIQSNPLNKICSPKLVYEDSRSISEENMKKLYATVALNSYSTLQLKRDTAILSIFVFCGIRRGELLSMSVDCVDFQKQLLAVRAEHSKAKKMRLIPLHPTLGFHLNEYFIERNKSKYRTPSLVVSLNKDMGLSSFGLKHWVKTLSRKSGVKFYIHQFRHAFATNLAEQNVNVVKIQKLLGHNSVLMTMSYLRSIRTEDLQDDINKLSI